MNKKLLQVLTTILLFLIIVVISVSASNIKFLGDVDGNDKVTAADARIILRHSANLEKISDEVSYLADINGDEKINAADARIALRMSAKIEDLFEFGEEYHLHDYESIIIKNATCLEEGKEQIVCKICDKIKNEIVIEKTEHTYVDTIKKESTCYAEGEKCSTCSYCGDTVFSTIKKVAHSFIEATCTSPKKCSICNITEGAPKGHKYNSTKCFVVPTCENCGIKSGTATGHNFSGLKCTKCGKQYDSMENYAVKCIREDLMYRLKNPNSLIINSIQYTIPNKEDRVFVLWINMSAMNGFGGYTRETIVYGIDSNGNFHYNRGYVGGNTFYDVDVGYVKKQLGLK